MKTSALRLGLRSLRLRLVGIGPEPPQKWCCKRAVQPRRTYVDVRGDDHFVKKTSLIFGQRFLAESKRSMLVFVAMLT